MDKREKFSGAIGIGLMACWLFSTLFCYGLKFWLWRYVGLAIVTVTMLSVFVYINSLEEENKKLKRKHESD